MKRIITILVLLLFSTGLLLAGCSSDESKQQPEEKTLKQSDESPHPWQDPRTPEERAQAREASKKRLTAQPYKSVPVGNPFPDSYKAPGDSKQDKPDEKSTKEVTP